MSHRFPPRWSRREALAAGPSAAGVMAPGRGAGGDDGGGYGPAREDPLRAVEVFDKRVDGVHLKDVKDATTFTVLGKKDLRTAELLRALEYEENESAPMDDLRACLAAVREAVRPI